MAPVFLPRVKLIARAMSVGRCEELVEQAMRCDEGNEIRDLVKQEAQAIWSEFLRGST